MLPVALLLAAPSCSRVGPPPLPASAASREASAVPGGGPLTQAALDALIDARWREAGVMPAPAAADGAFLRRVTLDLAGRIPTLAEARVFLDDRRPDKRTRAVDALLASDDFADYWSAIYANLLFGEAFKPRMAKTSDPRGWLRRAFAENWGYDRLARELITAQGDLRDNGAVAFVASRQRAGGVEAVTGAAARIFLGLQIQCAQCHDHPYDPRWKQEDFYGLVAYFSRTRARNQKVEAASMMTEADAEPAASMTPPPKNPRTLVLFDAPRGQARMRKPKSESDVTVQPRFLGRPLGERPGETRREAFARAVLESDLFPKAMVARTWAQLFGQGVVDPWDDLGAENDARHPPLLVALADDFRASGFDVKRLVRLLVLSSAYGRSAEPAAGRALGRPAGGPADETADIRAFARMGVRPLLPEQLFDTLVTATGRDQVIRRRFSDDAVQRRLAQAFREYRFVFGDDEMAQVDSFDGSVPQALLLFNGELTNGGARADGGGVLGRILASTRDPAARLDDMFLAVYTRHPTADERHQLLAYLKEQGGARAAYEDLYFALLTSTEAITNH
jgi:hypothetical protein